MTKLLEKAFKKASELPDMEQNALAKWVLEEIESEKKWDKLFSASEDMLDDLANEAAGEDKNKKTGSLDIDKLDI